MDYVGRRAGDVVVLELIPRVIVERRVVGTRPARLTRGIHFHGKVLEERSRSVVQTEIALVHQDEPGIVAIESAGGRVLILDPGQIAATVRIGGGESVSHPLYGRAKYRVDISPSGSGRNKTVI